MSWEIAAAKAVFTAMLMLHNMIIEGAIIPHCTKETWRVI
jgi:hypothetical protein